MRCSQCGLPLSPKRTNCPRCGTPINTSNQARAEVPPYPISPLAPQMAFPAQQPSQVLFEGRQDMSASEPAQEANMQASSPLPPAPNPTDNPLNRPGQPLAHKLYSSTRDSSKTIKIGLTSAGLCIILGSLLLVLVYLVGQGFLPAGGTTNTDNTRSTLTVNQTTTVTHLTTPTPPPITPTPTLPGQGLLDTALLSNDFNGTQPLTDFKVNQKIYLIFTPHPGGNSYTACVNWYLNDQLVNTYSQSITTIANVKYYFFASMPNTGNGRADISLSSTAVCTDAILAKKLNFMVSL